MFLVKGLHMSVIDIKPDAQGKVRDLYDLGDKLLLVATDRISAFDYILEDEIPHKALFSRRFRCSGSNCSRALSKTT